MLITKKKKYSKKKNICMHVWSSRHIPLGGTAFHLHYSSMRTSTMLVWFQVVALDQITKCIWWLHTAASLALEPKIIFRPILGILSHKGFLHYSMYTNSPTAVAQGKACNVEKCMTFLIFLQSNALNSHTVKIKTNESLYDCVWWCCWVGRSAVWKLALNLEIYCHSKNIICLFCFK